MICLPEMIILPQLEATFNNYQGWLKSRRVKDCDGDIKKSIPEYPSRISCLDTLLNSRITLLTRKAGGCGQGLGLRRCHCFPSTRDAELFHPVTQGSGIDVEEISSTVLSLYFAVSYGQGLANVPGHGFIELH